MATLLGTAIKDTYNGLLKLIDNTGLTASAKEITDGDGVGSGVFVANDGSLKASDVHATASIQNDGGYKDSTGALGTTGQILETNGSVTTWVTPSGGGSSILQSLDTVSLATINTWGSLEIADNWLSGSPSGTAGTSSAPSTWFKNAAFLKGKGSLTKLYFSAIEITTGGNFEIYIVSYDGYNSFSHTNQQVLVNETFSAMGGTSFEKTNFTIATNALNDKSMLMMFIRPLTGADTISGMKIEYGFES